MTGNICAYYKSFVGRDFKAFMQMALFILSRYLRSEDQECWFILAQVPACFFQVKCFMVVFIITKCKSTQVFRIAYCITFFPEEAAIHHHTCSKFVSIVLRSMPEIGRRLKIHLLLHLVDNILEFGPPSSFSTERYNLSCT